jgi:hypothetical protein
MKFKFIYLIYSLILLALLLIGTKLLSEIFLPFPLEFREGHVFSTTSLLIKGQNPYNLDFYPYYYNSYGILYNLIVLPFAFIFGNSFFIHRIINLVFILLSVFFIFRPIKTNKNNNITFRLIISLLVFLLLSFGSITMSPNNLGVLLYLLTLIIPVKFDFSTKSIILSAIFSISAFYTKPYFILGWIILSIYIFLFQNIKKAIIYNILYFFVFIILGFIISKLLPLYFYETIFGYSDSYISLEYSIHQLKDFALFSIPILMFIGLIFLMSVFHRKQSFNISLKENKFIYFSFFILLFLIFPLGINQGAYLSYHFQLLLPLLALFVINENFEDVDYLKQNKFILFLMIVLVFVPLYNIRPYTNKKDDIRDWKNLTDYLLKKHDVLNSSILSPIQIINNRKIYDNGVSGFVFGFRKNNITNVLFGLDDEILAKKEHYINIISAKISNKDFDAIVLNSNSENDINWWINKIDTNKYILKRKFNLRTNSNNYKWEVLAFEPKN